MGTPQTSWTIAWLPEKKIDCNKDPGPEALKDQTSDRVRNCLRVLERFALAHRRTAVFFAGIKGKRLDKHVPHCFVRWSLPKYLLG